MKTIALIFLWLRIIDTYLLLEVFFLFFLSFLSGVEACHMTCRIVSPRLGSKPLPPAMKAWNLNHWTPGEVPKMFSISKRISPIKITSQLCDFNSKCIFVIDLSLWFLAWNFMKFISNTEIEQDPTEPFLVQILSMSWPPPYAPPPFLICRKEASASLTFPEFHRADWNSC